MTDTGKWFLLACALLAAAGLYFLGPVLTPFAIAALLAYLGNPLVDRLQSWKLPRKPAVIAVFIVIFLGLLLLVILLVPLLERQTAVLLGQIPAALDWIHQTGAPWLERTLGLEEQLLDINRLKAAVTAHWQEAGGLAQTMLASATRSGRALLGWLAGMALIPVITFYLLLDWNLILKRIDAAVPHGMQAAARRWGREADEVLGAFLRGQISVMLSLGAFYALGLWIVGVKPALLIGLGAGLLSFVPYLGFIVGLATALIAAAVQGHGALTLLGVAVVFGCGQALEGMVLTPRLVGTRIGLHPVVVILVLLAGGQLFGFTGLLLALPVSAVAAVALRHTYQEYLESDLYRKG